MGGYPWKDGGCLIAKDLNAAIAGRNPLLDYPARAGETIVGFDGGVPIYGSFGSVVLPYPTTDTLGGVKAFTAPAGSFITGVTTTGEYTTGTPPATTGGGITSIPPPTPTTLGGVKSLAPVANNFVTGIDTTGAATFARPTFANISGMITNDQIPAPTVAMLGGVRSGSAPANQFATGISTTGDLVYGPASGNFVVPGNLQTGPGAAQTLSAGEVGFSKIVASASAPGSSGAKIALVCGTNAGTGKLVAYGGTSATPVTIVDNIGAGISGC